jgi:hypothetical protein
MAPLFEHYSIQLWTPEVGGRIDFHAEDHQETMLALGPGSGRAYPPDLRGQSLPRHHQPAHADQVDLHLCTVCRRA